MATKTTTKTAGKATPIPASAYAENPPSLAERQELADLEKSYFGKDAGTAAKADPTAEELASLRAELETVKAAVARLQGLAADAIVWAECPCGQDYRAVTQLTNAGIRGGRLWHDLSHYSFYGMRVEQ